MRLLAAITLSMLLPSLVAAQEDDAKYAKRRYMTQALNGAHLTIDGDPREPAWDAVEWAGDFVELSPDEGTEPSQETRFKILYDDDALCILPPMRWMPSQAKFRTYYRAEMAFLAIGSRSTSTATSTIERHFHLHAVFPGFAETNS
jgi:hypothetical protein